MRYFLLFFTFITLLIVGMLGFRGQVFERPPLRLFPDMDDQDKLKPQAASDFFADGMVERTHIRGTVPRGFDANDRSPWRFANSQSYLDAGKQGGRYGRGIPQGLHITNNAQKRALEQYGKEQYGVYCTPCHGPRGDGKGVIARIGHFKAANLMAFDASIYPDGQLFETISQGKGLMSGYASVLPVRARWAIIAYVRSLQKASLREGESSRKGDRQSDP